MQGDPLGGMNITPEGIAKRDAIVFDATLNHSPPIPVVMVLSGGYQMTTSKVIAESIINLNKQFSLIKYSE